MRSGPGLFKFAFLLVGVLCIPVLGEARLFLVPAGEDPTEYAEGPTEVTLRPWQSIAFDIFLENTTPQGLRFYVVTLDSATGGETGTVEYQVGSALINVFRADSVFFQCLCLASVDPGPPARFAWALGIGVSRVVTDPKYLGELRYAASNDACGTFVIDFIDPGSGTRLTDPDLNPIPFVAEQTVIRMLDRADLNSDGRVDLLDILTVLNGLAGVFESGADVSDVDIASMDPCARDGLINLFDILAVLDGFQGIDPCTERCLPKEP